jgi:Ca2+-binding EF-hand superfamily protein
MNTSGEFKPGHTMSLAYSDKELAIREELAITMDIHPDAKEQWRTYPSIRDYYEGNRKDLGKPMQLQKGLSNFSGLVLGDDRIAFSESILSATYRIPVEEKMSMASPSKNKTQHTRRRDYKDALDATGNVELDRLERVMKDKLFQRSYATSSPFQVRKAFKFFDREKTLRISIEGFTSALEFLGFQFAEIQNVALFGRYDKDFSGEIDYMHFINHAMFYSPFANDEENAPPPKPKKSTPWLDQGVKKAISDQHAALYHVADMEKKELEAMQKAQLQGTFNKIDPSGRGLNRGQLEVLCAALGQPKDAKKIDKIFYELGVPDNAGLTFELFYDYWTSDVGVALM